MATELEYWWLFLAAGDSASSCVATALGPRLWHFLVSCEYASLTVIPLPAGLQAKTAKGRKTKSMAAMVAANAWDKEE